MVMGNFDTFSRQKNTYFHHQDDYSNEKMLYDLLVTEAYNLHGVCMTYFVTSYNTSGTNVIFAEDQNRNVLRFFDFMSYYELPKEEKLFEKYGIAGLDNFHIYISTRHFQTASTCDNNGTVGINTAIQPKVGDFIQANYNNFVYDILSVKETVLQFLQGQHSWDIIVKPYINNNITANISTSAMNVSAILNPPEIFDIGNIINNKKDQIIYNQPVCEENKSTGQGDW
jgi:hypothetical protein